MISKSKLLENLRLDIGTKLFELLSNDFINKVLYFRVLPRFSDWYPLLCRLRITKDDAVPFQNFDGRITNFGTYRIPKQFDVPWLDVGEEFHWRDIEDYNIGANDMSDVYTGGNFVLNTFFLQARSNMPHTRSYFELSLHEPDLSIITPPQQVHRDFPLAIPSARTLKTIPRNLETLFEQYFIANIKWAMYQDRKYEAGSQTYAGIEIDTKIDDLADAKNDIKELEDIFEKGYKLSPERIAVQCLYQYKA